MHCHVGLQFRAQLACFNKMSQYAVFDVKVAGPRLEHRTPIVWKAKARKPIYCFQRRQLIDVQAMLSSRFKHAWHDSPVWVTRLKQADLMIKLLPRALRELFPKHIRPQDKRHVVGMFEIRLTDDASPAMRTSSIVAWWKAI